MTQFLGERFLVELKKEIKNSKKSIMIISPYITNGAVETILNSLPNKSLEMCVITRPPGPEYLDGSISIDALLMLKNKGFKMIAVSDLHAKLYLIDNRILFIGSANFTSKGLYLNNHGNVEEMIKITITNNDLSHINTRYLKNQGDLNLSDELVKRIKQGIKHFNEVHLKLEKDMYDWLPRERSIFSTFQSTKRYPLNFQFQISKKGGEEILNNQEEVLFKLGGSIDSPDRTLLVSNTEMEKLLTKTTMNLKSRSWMFRISFINEKPIFRITDRKTKKEKIIKLNNCKLKVYS